MRIINRNHDWIETVIKLHLIDDPINLLNLGGLVFRIVDEVFNFNIIKISSTTLGRAALLQNIWINEVASIVLREVKGSYISNFKNIT